MIFTTSRRSIGLRSDEAGLAGLRRLEGLEAVQGVVMTQGYSSGIAAADGLVSRARCCPADPAEPTCLNGRDPVKPSSGDEILTETDIRIDGGGDHWPLLQQPRSGSLDPGPAWSRSLSRRLTFSYSKSHLYRECGSPLSMQPNPTPAPPAGARQRIGVLSLRTAQ